MSISKKIGEKGEREAQFYLLANDFEILACNYRYKRCEIDIIAKKNNMLVFVEVKTRGSDTFGTAETFVSSAQQNRIHTAAMHFIEENEHANEIRFDIIALQKNKDLYHIEDAFFPIDGENFWSKLILKLFLWNYLYSIYFFQLFLFIFPGKFFFC